MFGGGEPIFFFFLRMSAKIQLLKNANEHYVCFERATAASKEHKIYLCEYVCERGFLNLT